MAHTITYDNGDVYTVADDEFVFVVKQSELWTRKIYNNGKTNRFEKVFPWTKVDYTPPDTGVVDEQPGSHLWCKAYVPWSEGFTFAMQLWQRACDSNKDGVYDENDERWPDGEG
jgi:hypothetical protein